MGQPRSIDKAIANLIKWAERAEWADKYQSLFEALIGPVSQRHDMTPDQLARTLEEAGYGGMVFGMVFEDFLTRRWPDGRNLVDDYLARRGWREDPPGRRYLQMLRDSSLSVYEVVEVAPGQHCDLLPLLEAGPRVRVYEHLGTRDLVRWDRIAARVLREGDRYRFTGGILPLSHELSRQLGTIEQALLSKTRRSLEEGFGPGASAALPEDELMSLTREALAPAITQLWLDDTLKRLTAPPPG